MSKYLYYEKAYFVSIFGCEQSSLRLLYSLLKTVRKVNKLHNGDLVGTEKSSVEEPDTGAGSGGSVIKLIVSRIRINKFRITDPYPVPDPAPDP